MEKIILDLLLSYGDCMATLKKELEIGFVPIPGMKVKFPKKTHIGTITVWEHEDNFSEWEWDMENNTAKVFLGDVNTNRKDTYLKRLKGLIEDGWEVTDIDSCIEKVFDINMKNWRKKLK